MLQVARQLTSHPLLAYINADIVLCNDFAEAVKRHALSSGVPVLLFGRRTDIDVRGRLDFDAGWQQQLAELGRGTGFDAPGGADYFVFSRDLYPDMPPFALGRGAWDIWMIHAALAAGADVMDASAIVRAWHQIHDYNHLPEQVRSDHPRGRRDWKSKGPETDYNESLFQNPAWITPYHHLVRVLAGQENRKDA